MGKKGIKKMVMDTLMTTAAAAHCSPVSQVVGNYCEDMEEDDDDIGVTRNTQI
jgi:hypothetical protein